MSGEEINVMAEWKKPQILRLRPSGSAQDDTALG
jgi:hypothetical protein